MNFIHMFNLIDADHSGEITKEELILFMQANNFNEDFVDKWLHLFDLNQRGRITIDDYCERLGLEIDEKISKKFKKPRPSIINLDDLDDFVNIDETMGQHIVHVSTSKPLATPTKRSSNMNISANSKNRSNNDKDETPENITEDIIVKTTAHVVYEGLPYSENDSPKKPKDEDKFIDLSESFSNFFSNFKSISLPRQTSANAKKNDIEKKTEKKQNENDDIQSVSPLKMIVSKLKLGGTSPKSQSHFTFGKSTNANDMSLKDEPTNNRISENLDQSNWKNKLIDTTLDKDNINSMKYEFNDNCEISKYNNSENITPNLETINEYQNKNINNIKEDIFDPRPVVKKSMSNDFPLRIEENEDNILTQKIVNIENMNKPTYNLLYKNDNEFKSDPNTDFIKSKSIEPLLTVVANDPSFESNLKDPKENIFIHDLNRPKQRDRIYLQSELNDSAICNCNISTESDQSKENSYFSDIIPKMKTDFDLNQLVIDDQLYSHNDEKMLKNKQLLKRDLDPIRIKNNEQKFLENESESFLNNTLSLTTNPTHIKNNSPRIDINDPLKDTVRITNHATSKTFLETLVDLNPRELNEIILNNNESMESRNLAKNIKVADEIKEASDTKANTLNQGNDAVDRTIQDGDLQKSVNNTMGQYVLDTGNKNLFKDQGHENIICETYNKNNLIKNETETNHGEKNHSKEKSEITDYVDSLLKQSQDEKYNDPENKSCVLNRDITKKNQNGQENINYFNNKEYKKQKLINDNANASPKEENYDKKGIMKKHKSEIIFRNPASSIDPENETNKVKNLSSLIDVSPRNIKERSSNTPGSYHILNSPNNDLCEYHKEHSVLNNIRTKDSDDRSLSKEPPNYKGLCNNELKQNKYLSHSDNEDDKNLSQTNSKVVKRNENILSNDKNTKDVLNNEIINEDSIEEKINIQSCEPLNQSPKWVEDLQTSSLTTKNDNVKENSFQYIFIKGVKSQRNFKIIYKDIDEETLPKLINDIVNIFEEVNDSRILNLTELIKTFLDDNYDKVWHVILTDDEYQLYLSYESIIIFQYDALTFLIWKTL